jgi:hypothetical protein
VQIGLTAVVPFFSPTSIWNAPLSPSAALDPRSSAIVANLGRQVAAGPDGFGTGSGIYVVGPAQPTAHVTFDGGASTSPLQRAWNAVPIPAGAQPTGADGYLIVDQPSTDTMWEFFKLHVAADGSGWHAQWGGRILHASTDPGYYRNAVDPSGNILEKEEWGAPASSLPLAGGLMTISELQAGSVNHALALLVHNACAGVWAAPAQRTDGNITADPNCVPEGAHFRLDPKLNLASLNLPHFVYMEAVAVQKYGLVVDDRTAGVGFRTENPDQFEKAYGYNPYLGPQNQAGTPGALWDQTPAQMTREFPWSHLQLLRMTRRTQPDTTTVVETP